METALDLVKGPGSTLATLAVAVLMLVKMLPALVEKAISKVDASPVVSAVQGLQAELHGLRDEIRAVRDEVRETREHFQDHRVKVAELAIRVEHLERGDTAA